MGEKPLNTIVWEDNPSAPFITFDLAGTSCIVNGAFSVTLSARKMFREGPGKDPMTKATTTAHLRMTQEAARSLMRALNACFEIAEEAQLESHQKAVNQRTAVN
jgi:hypothetical protein